MFSDPERNVDKLELEPAMYLADFGAGSGFYALAAARRLKQGRVYAVDIQKDLLERLRNEAAKKGLSNIEVVWADLEKAGSTKLGNASVDAIIISNILFQVENKKAMIDEAYRIMKPKAKLLLVDWADSYGGLGPAQGQIVPVMTAERYFTDNGFLFERQIPAGEHHYGLIFRKK